MGQPPHGLVLGLQLWEISSFPRQSKSCCTLVLRLEGDLDLLEIWLKQVRDRMTLHVHGVHELLEHG